MQGPVHLRGVLCSRYYAPRFKEVKAALSVIGKTKIQLFDEVEFELGQRGQASGFTEGNVTIDYLTLYLSTI